MNAAALTRVIAAPPRRLWGHYIKQLERSPRATKSCTSVLAALLGDALAQHISNSDKDSWE